MSIRSNQEIIKKYNMNNFKFNTDDIITTDGYLEFCNKNNICYIKTDYFYTGSLIWRGQRHPINVSDICVAGHSDHPINDNISNNHRLIFCVNRNTNNDNVFGLPLGITNDSGESQLHSVYGNKQSMVDASNESIDKQTLAYLNFNINTYYKERQYVFDKFKNQPWTKIGNIVNTIEGRKQFLRDIKASKFVICPRGNGIDTHRLWETLYMGSIPVVKYEPTHHLFKDLPILFINDWDEVTEEFLNEKYIEITNKEWNMEKLKLSYWENFIRTTISNIQ